ncbi:MAG: hypothetical protein JWN73_14 [Betaproteobacteria bacterium]|nr:hypothetical protein [Betaproteobacteria bacterium]
MKTIYTIGHSTRPVEEFIGLLEAAGVRVLADVRAYPASRRHPQFGRAALAESLGARGIDYLWLGAALGGHRDPLVDTVNTALAPMWRGYADHTQAQVYRDGLAQLEERALTQALAYMCAERDPGDCHRNLISDSLVSRGWKVTHLIGAEEKREHRLHPAARVSESGLIYPSLNQQQLGLGF